MGRFIKKVLPIETNLAPPIPSADKRMKAVHKLVAIDNTTAYMHQFCLLFE